MDSDDEYEESTASYRGLPATIILIDVLNPKAEIAHAATCRMIRQYLRQSGSHLVGVCLFGENVTDIFSLTTPTLEDYKKLQDTKISNLKVGKELILSNALLHCSKGFANCKKRLSTRTVIILTNLDTPPIETDQTPALKRAEDLAQSNVYIKLINVSETEHEGDKFYKYFLTNANKERYENLPRPISDVKEIEKLMYQESHRHLAVARLSFEIGNGMSIGVGLYNLLKDSRQSLKSAYLNSETNEIVTSVTEKFKVSFNNSTMDVDDEEQQPKQVPLLKSELVYWQEYGGERVEMTDTEMKFLQNAFGPPMLKLLGFKPATLLSKEKWYLRKGYFLFPNEDIIEGSTVAFKALYQACIETGMVAICMLCTRVNSKPINVALSPCANPLGLDIDVGFYVIHIPFVQNVRNLPEIDDVELNITNSHKTVLKDIINAIKFDYKADMFENPRVQSQYKNLEALALNEEDIEAFIDTTKPNPDKFNNLDSDLFQEIFGPFASVAVKRPTGSQGTGNAKKIKTEEIDESTQIKTEEIDMSTLQSRVANRKVYQYTVPQMKQILKSKEITDLPALTGLKKEQLVELVYKYFKF